MNLSTLTETTIQIVGPPKKDQVAILLGQPDFQFNRNWVSIYLYGDLTSINQRLVEVDDAN